MKNNKLSSILIADDDLEDCQMMREALEESQFVNEINFVHNGEELMSWLRKRWETCNESFRSLPDLILLDLNMPKMDGREVLKELKHHSFLHRIPVVVFSTSGAEEDILNSYDLGANSFITKPVEFNSLVEILRDLSRYWFQIVALPYKPKDQACD